MTGILNVSLNFKKILHIGLSSLGALQIILLLSGKLLALFPIAGLGGFIISAPEIVGTDFQQIPYLTFGHRLPTVFISMAAVNMNHGFTLTKPISLTATPIGQIISSVNLSISTKSLSVTGLMMESTGLHALEAQFENFSADNRDDDHMKHQQKPVFELRAQTLDLQQAFIQQDALRIDSISLDFRSLKTSFVIHPHKSDTIYGK